MSLVDLETLRRLPLFSRLDDARLARVAGLAALECVAAGAVLLREKEPAEQVRLVVDGRVSIEIEVPGAREALITTVSSGELLGWSALLGSAVWLASARALKNTTLIALPGLELRELCESDHELGYHVMSGAFETVARRLQDSWLQLIGAY